jgi:hypothetical protein
MTWGALIQKADTEQVQQVIAHLRLVFARINEITDFAQ